MANLLAQILAILQKIKPVYLVIIVLVVIILLQRACQPTQEVCPECPQFDTTGFIASLPILYPDTVVEYVPKPYIVYKDKEKQVIVEVPADIDSLEIAQSYFTKWVLQDTILNDTNGLIVINDVLWMNKIVSRMISPKEIYPHYKVVTKTVTKPYIPRFKMYIGGGIGGWKDKFGASAKVLFQTKKDHVYGLSYDPIQHYAEGSMYWKIKIKSK